MGWKLINGHRYYYRSERRNGRVVTEYVGDGDCGQLIELQQRDFNIRRSLERADRQSEEEASEAGERIVAEWFNGVQAVADAAVAAAGFHKHRGQWRRRRMKVIATIDESGMEEDGLSQELVDGWGSTALALAETFMAKAHPDKSHTLAREAVRRKIEQVQAELEGANPTPLERILAQRAALCWWVVHWLEKQDFRDEGRRTIQQADHSQRKIDRAHRRFLSAVETLAKVRKMAVPTLQVNIAKNQVNVAAMNGLGNVGPTELKRL